MASVDSLLQDYGKIPPHFLGVNVPSQNDLSSINFIDSIDLRHGIKYDQEKSRVDLIDSDFLEELGMVLKFGSEKYGPDNWRGGIKIRRIIGAALRHLYAIMRNEDYDKESGLRHVAHLACNVMFLAVMLKTRPDMDDRFKG